MTIACFANSMFVTFFEIFTSVNDAKNKIDPNVTPFPTHTFNSYRGTYVHGCVVYDEHASDGMA